ncbi:MAG: sulfite exporter TauE/SafE family protein [Spirosomataceae bacterium]
MDILSAFTVELWVLVFSGAFIIGLSKAGLKGIELLNVTIMALVFGGKASTGVVLPLLCVADILAVIYYNRHAQWAHFWRLVPWIILGVLIGVYAGNEMNEAIFKKMMAIIIVLTVLLMFWIEYRKSENVPSGKLFVVMMGLITGTTTMLGNLAGPFSTIYFLALRVSKNDFIGTAAWLFLFINLFKLPFQAFFWKNITLSTLKLDLMLLPAVFLGFFVGIRLVALIRDNSYRKVILALTLLGAIVIFMK